MCTIFRKSIQKYRKEVINKQGKKVFGKSFSADSWPYQLTYSEIVSEKNARKFKTIPITKIFKDEDYGRIFSQNANVILDGKIAVILKLVGFEGTSILAAQQELEKLRS